MRFWYAFDRWGWCEETIFRTHCGKDTAESWTMARAQCNANSVCQGGGGFLFCWGSFFLWCLLRLLMQSLKFGSLVPANTTDDGWFINISHWLLCVVLIISHTDRNGIYWADDWNLCDRCLGLGCSCLEICLIRTVAKWDHWHCVSGIKRFVAPAWIKMLSFI